MELNEQSNNPVVSSPKVVFNHRIYEPFNTK